MDASEANFTPEKNNKKRNKENEIDSSRVNFSPEKKNKKRNKENEIDSMENFIQSLPKVELHVHLDGSFESEIIYKHLMATSDFSCLPVQTILPWDLKSKFPVRQLVMNCKDFMSFSSLCSCRGKYSLHEMIKCFEIFNPIVRGNLQLIESLSFDFCRRQAEQRVIYTEVRYSPHLLASGSSLMNGDVIVDAVPVINAVTKGLREGSKKFGIIVNQIFCCITFRPDWSMNVIELANERRNSYPCAVVGVDIAAGEEHFDAENHSESHHQHLKAMQKAQNLNLNITLHAGEMGGGENVANALHNYGAQRIGHGYHIVDDDLLMKEIQEKKIHIETCPVSSIETGSCKFEEKENWMEHPCMTMMKNNLSISFSSDDPAVFNTSLSSQYRIVMKNMKKGEELVLNSVRDAIAHAFCSNEVKDDLRCRIQEFEEERSMQRERIWDTPFCDRIKDLSNDNQ